MPDLLQLTLPDKQGSSRQDNDTGWERRADVQPRAAEKHIQESAKSKRRQAVILAAVTGTRAFAVISNSGFKDRQFHTKN